jgi:hypothetical protein
MRVRVRAALFFANLAERSSVCLIALTYPLLPVCAPWRVVRKFEHRASMVDDSTNRPCLDGIHLNPDFAK